jgi:hypothetical protein
MIVYHLKMERVPKEDVNSQKTVGRRMPPADLLSTAQDTRRSAQAWRKALPTPFVPRGVYRFETHEEAGEWLMKMLTRPSVAEISNRENHP